MARLNLDAWVPEERGSAVLNVVNSQSAVEAVARREPMASDTKSVPRAGGVDVDVTPKGGAYTESGATDDEVVLKARKFTGLLRIAEEDLDDIPANVIAMKQRAWANSYARKLDNAALGTTGVENGTTVPFTSVYADIVANKVANRVQSAGDVDYADLSAVFGLVETGDYFDETGVVVIAHPSFKGTFRGLVDGNGRPLFIDNAAQGASDRLFGYEVRWSAGARTSATASASPAGNALLIVANRESLILGVRSGPESAVIDGFTGASALTDEALVKMRSRRGFALGHPGAAAILEVTAGA